MSMELLGPKIGVNGEGPMSTAHLAAQMLSALQHVHGHGTVHRDIKSSNILRCLHDPPQIWLIDFGILHPLLKNADTAALAEDPVVVGTLHYASLNAHRGIALTRHDDLESLAYVLFSEIRTDGLPWQIMNRALVTSGFVRRQVRECKCAWSGERLADGYEPIFGTFLDELTTEHGSTTSLSLRDPRHSTLVVNGGSPPLHPTGIHHLLVGPPESNATPSKSNHDSPVHPGQLVYAHLLPKQSIEGYTIQSQAHPSVWQDPTLSDAAWLTTFLPSTCALTRRETDAGVSKMQVHGDASSEQVRVVGEALMWTPSQDARIPTHRSLDKDSLDVLRAKVGAPGTTHSPLPDNKMAMLKFLAYVEGRPLNLDTLCGLTCGAVNWASSRMV
ncbi:hypothetical protein B0H10DRAFT_2210122 [Mycena sp. CBHHK59/15]|nr:hypothetical protein B0H10DRAFT_2210122 [Mycena sp. CBHHK59/15]